MAEIHPGRYTAELDGPVVVFLIGMRVNKLWKVWAWLPVFLAMFPMLYRLMRDPDRGLLGSKTWLSWRQVMLVQYWESFEKLEAFARSPDEPHVDAWARFNQRLSGSGDTGIEGSPPGDAERRRPVPAVGIWHETYRIEPGTVECVYGDMPRVGLPAATDHVPATGTRLTARRRLGGQDPGPPVDRPAARAETG